MEYVTHPCSRFQAENLLLHSPAGTFLLRTCQPFSPFFILSYGEEEKQVVGEDEAERVRLVVKQRMIEKTETGYVSGNTYETLDAILSEMKECLHYGLRLNEKLDVVSCESMPWFNMRKVREIKSDGWYER